MVPQLSIIFMAVSCLIAFVIPVALFLYLRRKYHADILAFLIGCAVMLVFALMLESFAHQLILNGSPLGAVITSSPWLYALYGGLMAGLFEETGRLIAFRTVLRRGLGKDGNALMYGAGHGGLEAIVLVGLSYISNLVTAKLINSGNISAITESLSGDTLAQTKEVIQTLVDTPPYQFLLGGLERIPAIALQIALSVLVWFAVKKKAQGLGRLFPIAILLHFLVDGVTVLLSATTLPVYVTEIVVLLMAAAVCFYAWKVWAANKTDPEDEAVAAEQ
jgi:uncharacterized membrane protein YhfC